MKKMILILASLMLFGISAQTFSASELKAIKDVPKHLFDAHTGVPLYYYAELPDGKIELFTSPGYHPRYQTRLKLLTKKVAKKYLCQNQPGIQNQSNPTETTPSPNPQSLWERFINFLDDFLNCSILVNCLWYFIGSICTLLLTSVFGNLASKYHGWPQKMCYSALFCSLVLFLWNCLMLLIFLVWQLLSWSWQLLSRLFAVTTPAAPSQNTQSHFDQLCIFLKTYGNLSIQGNGLRYALVAIFSTLLYLVFKFLADKVPWDYRWLEGLCLFVTRCFMALLCINALLFLMFLVRIFGIWLFCS